MLTDTSKTKRDTKLDDDTEDARRGVLRDGETRRFSMMMMDHDPTGLSLNQKQAFCDAINRGEGFDRALELARSSTTANDVRLHQPGYRGDKVPQAVNDAYDKRSARLSNAWRDSAPQIERAPGIAKPAQPVSAVTQNDVANALDRRNARLASAYKA